MCMEAFMSLKRVCLNLISYIAICIVLSNYVICNCGIPFIPFSTVELCHYLLRQVGRLYTVQLLYSSEMCQLYFLTFNYNLFKIVIFTQFASYSQLVSEFLCVHLVDCIASYWNIASQLPVANQLTNYIQLQLILQLAMQLSEYSYIATL